MCLKKFIKSCIINLQLTYYCFIFVFLPFNLPTKDYSPFCFLPIEDIVALFRFLPIKGALFLFLPIEDTTPFSHLLYFFGSNAVQ